MACYSSGGTPIDPKVCSTLATTDKDGLSYALHKKNEPGMRMEELRMSTVDNNRGVFRPKKVK
jgi:hypothetical protein